ALSLFSRLWCPCRGRPGDKARPHRWASSRRGPESRPTTTSSWPLETQRPWRARRSPIGKAGRRTSASIQGREDHSPWEPVAGQGQHSWLLSGAVRRARPKLARNPSVKHIDTVQRRAVHFLVGRAAAGGRVLRESRRRNLDAVPLAKVLGRL